MPAFNNEIEDIFVKLELCDLLTPLFSSSKLLPAVKFSQFQVENQKACH